MIFDLVVLLVFAAMLVVPTRRALRSDDEVTRRGPRDGESLTELGEA